MMNHYDLCTKKLNIKTYDYANFKNEIFNPRKNKY